MRGQDRGASIRARLLDKAKARRQDFNLVLTRYVLERLLYRLSRSPYAEQFLLKGALLFDLWFDVPHRPTRDADLLGFGPTDTRILASVFRDLCIAVVEPDDGVRFDPETVRAEAIRKDAHYGGIRITLVGVLAGARCSVQVDVGFGDAVTPAPEPVDYPSLLPELPSPRLRAYPRYSVIAEKLEALVVLGIANSRMKDYFDLWVLACHSDLEAETLQRAVRATFERRGTPIPQGIPFGLSEDFAGDPLKQIQWRAFISKNGLQPLSLVEVLALLRAFLVPVLDAIASGVRLEGHWSRGGTWC